MLFKPLREINDQHADHAECPCSEGHGHCDFFCRNRMPVFLLVNDRNMTAAKRPTAPIAKKGPYSTHISLIRKLPASLLSDDTASLVGIHLLRDLECH